MGRGLRRLILAEKFSAARRLAQILSEGMAEKVRADVSSYFTFSSGGDDVIVFPLRGHIVEIDYPESARDWVETDLDALVDLEPVRQESPPALHDALRGLADSIDEVVLATDFDREGELIGVERLETGTAKTSSRGLFGTSCSSQASRRSKRPRSADPSGTKAAPGHSWRWPDSGTPPSSSESSGEITASRRRRRSTRLRFWPKPPAWGTVHLGRWPQPRSCTSAARSAILGRTTPSIRLRCLSARSSTDCGSPRTTITSNVCWRARNSTRAAGRSTRRIIRRSIRPPRRRSGERECGQRSTT